ncbi:MAG TPA: glycerol-3-phosphate dehydrogenase/oxidase [Bosea sp. (in: a-proteobacteria)]|jgi:glycerol-3-phosphate dehydrogenase|nr:glycerol-3-phosphate dehydrogenase/oxidase [Bosea sp. (in: a-proteobacteria)]
MAQDRAERIDALRRKGRAQVLVVGGGINGISTFRELALNGVDVVLVERRDFMSGASSAPSRMIHGGLRYMENGEFALVRESLRERNLLLANAPHLVSPLPTLIPVVDRFSGLIGAVRRFFGGAETAGARGALIIKLGLSLYDLYAGRDSGVPRHSFFGSSETKRRWPALRSDIVGSALYYDARISHPERLGIELILDSEQASPQALALNHLGLVGLEPGGAVLQDGLTGERFTLDAGIIVNATGAWIDLTNQELAGKAPRLIGGTKGSHLVIANRRLYEAIGETMIYFANREGRVCILFRHLGQVLAGSTDISVETPDGVRCEPNEAAYILASIAEVFPDIPIAPDELIYRFSGVRPLPRSDRCLNASISRDHSCEWLDQAAGAARPVLNLVGGKWTTFRAFGADAADMVLIKLDLPRRMATEHSAIGGGRDYPSNEHRQAWIERIAKAAGLTRETAERLLARYGARAAEYARTLSGGGDEALRSLPAYGQGEIAWIINRERPETLADLVLRRLTIAFTGELSHAAVIELSEIMAVARGWNERQRVIECAALLTELNTNHGVSEAMLR